MSDPSALYSRLLVVIMDTTPSLDHSINPLSVTNEAMGGDDLVTQVNNVNVFATNRSQPLTPQSFIEYQIALRLYSIYPIITAAVGTVGNTLALIVLVQRKLRRSSPCVYMAALAVTDTVVLWSTFFGMVSVVYYPSMNGLWFCKMVSYVSSISSPLSSWLVVTMTIERFIVVYFPFKSGKFCNVKNARIAVCLLAAFFVILSVHEPITINYDPRIKRCRNDESKYGTFLKAFGYIDATIACFAPEILLLTFNSLIVLRIKQSAAVRKDMAGQSAAETSGQHTQVTVMLLTVSFVFCILITPYAIFFIGKNYWIDLTDMENYARLALAQQCCIFMIMLNHSINFVLYFVSGKRFRNELIRVLLCRKESDLRSTATSMTKASDGNISKSAVSVTDQTTM